MSSSSRPPTGKAPDIFTVDFLTDISDTPVSIQVGGQVLSFSLQVLLKGESVPGASW